MNPLLTVYIIAGLTAVVCALAGVFLVLRRMAMVADAISHSVLPGLVAGFWFAQGPNLLTGFIGAVAAGLITVWAVEALAKTRQIREDAAIGLVFPAMFAIGVLWISLQYGNVHLDADAVLFGEITLAPFDRLVLNGQDLGPQSIWLLGLALVANVAFLTAFRKELVVSTFDPVLARLQGFRPAIVHYGLMTIVAITTVAAFTAVGAILAVALIIVPTVAASLFTRKLTPLVGSALAFGLLAAILGTTAAIRFDLSISGLVAVALGLVFAAGLAFSPQSGVLARRLQLRRQRLEIAIQALLVHLLNHLGEDDQTQESSLAHLHTELGWTPDWVHTVTAQAVRRDLVHQTKNVLSLTPKGKHLAARSETIDLPALR